MVAGRREVQGSRVGDWRGSGSGGLHMSRFN